MIVLESYVTDLVLGPAAHLRHYVHKTQTLRSSDQLFVTTVEPYRPVSTQTVASWIRTVTRQSGQEGSVGSTRSASPSKAAHAGARLKEVLAAAD